MQYRSEIDGLRTIAVVPVVLLHAGFGALPGGFLGVDVFFVISGYLITSILLSELGSGSFSLMAFYERRARRILPALYVVMGASVPFACAWMLPEPLENFGQSLVATTLFANNILLTLTSGYWALESEFKPLLHTWSLGVEEQFYLFFPLLLWSVHRWLRPALPVLLLVLFAVSLGLSEWGSKAAPDSTFYLLHTRAWELLVGALCSVALHKNWCRFSPGLLANVTSATGLLMVLSAMWALTPATRTPSLYALWPTLGAALVILATQPGTFTKAVLGWQPMVSVGLISYSLYLWHQPLVSFARVYSQNPPDTALKAVVVGLAFVCAWLSWRFVERPFRNASTVTSPVLWFLSGGFALVVVGFGYTLHTQHGFPNRLYAASDATSADMYISYNMRVHAMSKDRFENTTGPRVLVMGNSYARDFVNMVMETYPDTKAEIVYRDFFYNCYTQTTDTTVQNLFQQADVVVLASGDADPTCLQQDRLATEALGKAFWVVGTKKFGYNLNWVARTPAEARSNLRNKLLAETVEQEQRMKAMVPPKNFISLLDAIVVGEEIPITDERGRLLSADREHLTKHGAVYIGLRVLPTSPLAQVLSPKP